MTAHTVSLQDSHLTLKSIRGIAYTLRLLVGVSTGLYILVYLAAIGGVASATLGIPSRVIGLAALAFIFALEYFLQLLAGALADKHGTKSTFVVSFILRGVFTALLAVLFVWNPPGSAFGMLIAIVGAMSVFAIAFTLFSGNYEEWLRQQCIDYQEGSTAFAWSEVLFYIGLAFGAAAALLLTTGVALIASSAISLCAAVICAAIPSKKRSSTIDNADTVSSLKSPLDFIHAAKRDLQTSLPDLKVSFWAYAVLYGITQAIEGLVPLVYLSSASNSHTLRTKLLVLVGCLWFPSILGASAKLYQDKFRSSKQAPAVLERSTPLPDRSIRSLRQACLLYCAACLFVAISSLTPEVVRLTIFTIALICARIAFGVLRPMFFNYNASRVKDFYDVKDIRTPKTLLSIAEQRAKIGAILAISLTAVSEWIWGSAGMSSSGYWGIGLTAVGLAIYVLIKLHPPRDLA